MQVFLPRVFFWLVVRSAIVFFWRLLLKFEVSADPPPPFGAAFPLVIIYGRHLVSAKFFCTGSFLRFCLLLVYPSNLRVHRLGLGRFLR